MCYYIIDVSVLVKTSIVVSMQHATILLINKRLMEGSYSTKPKLTKESYKILNACMQLLKHNNTSLSYVSKISCFVFFCYDI